MEITTTVFYTFVLVFVGEMGDKTQIAAGTGALANRGRTRTIFLSSALALTTVAGLTVFFAGFIPANWIPVIQKIGGVLLVGYAVYLFKKAGVEAESEESTDSVGWKLFITHFVVVFIAELGDKTQIATLAVAVDNQTQLLPVFFASAGALVTVTALTVWGVTKLPARWIVTIQRIGAILMAVYGIYMFF